MKKHLIIILCIITALALTSCKKEEAEETVTVEETGAVVKETEKETAAQYPQETVGNDLEDKEAYFWRIGPPNELKGFYYYSYTLENDEKVVSDYKDYFYVQFSAVNAFVTPCEDEYGNKAGEFTLDRTDDYVFSLRDDGVKFTFVPEENIVMVEYADGVGDKGITVYEKGQKYEDIRDRISGEPVNITGREIVIPEKQWQEMLDTAYYEDMHYIYSSDVITDEEDPDYYRQGSVIILPIVDNFAGACRGCHIMVNYDKETNTFGDVTAFFFRQNEGYGIRQADLLGYNHDYKVYLRIEKDMIDNFYKKTDETISMDTIRALCEGEGDE